jgi:type I restriction enzyme S subunit
VSAAIERVHAVPSDLLPSGWRNATLPELIGETGIFVDGDWIESKDQDPSGDVRLVQLADIGDGIYRDRSDRFLTSKKAEQLRCTVLQPGDMLVARMPDPLGRACIFPGDRRAAVTVVDVAVVRTSNPLVNSRWLMYCINSPQFRRAVASLQSGSTRMRISRKNLSKIVFPFPPRAAQDEIVSELEKQFSRLDEAVANLQRVKANLKRYKASVLKEAVEGRLVGTEGNWTTTKLGSLALTVRNGYSGKPDADFGTRIFRISAVRSMELNGDDVRYLGGASSNFESFMAAEGDVLFTRYNGSRDYVGVCAVVPGGLPPTVYPDKLIRVRVPTSVLLPAYLVIAASTGQGRDFIESKIRTTAGQSGISGADIKALPLSIPTLHEQVRIVAEVGRRLSLVRGVENEVDANLMRADALRQSVLTTSFAGP